MSWNVRFDERAERDVARLDKETRRRVIEKTEWLADNFDTIAPVPLAGEHKGFYKLRAGDWRVFYEIDWKKEMLIVRYIDHRSRAYRK